MKIFFIRHGETTGDVENRYGGAYDDHLTGKGRTQSQNLAEVLKDKGVEIIYSSSLIRSQETSQILTETLACEVKIVPELQERNQYSFLSGMIKEEAIQKYPKEVELLKDKFNTIEGAESYEDFSNRISEIFKSLVETSKFNSIALVSHGGPLRILFRDILKWGELKEIGDCAYVELEKKETLSYGYIQMVLHLVFRSRYSINRFQHRSRWPANNMNRIVIIGTLHLGLTPKNDLLKILEEIKPDQLLLELPQEKTARFSAARHSDEMVFSATWARTKGIRTDYFDADTSILRDGASEEDPRYKQLVSREIAEMKAFTWQELNKKEPWREDRLASVRQEFWREFIDQRKWESREEKMLENINKLRIPQGTVLVLTGSGHLDFFQRELPEAEFPFRD